MSEQTKPTSAQKRPRVPISELLLAASTIVATVVVACAITDPKLPPFVGD